MRSVLFALFALAVSAPVLDAQAPRLPRVLVQTELGDIEIEIDSVRAPVSAANFLKYVDVKAYDGGLFRRAVTMANQPTDDVKIEVIQGGRNPAPETPRFPSIPLERTNVTGLLHKDGVISMARGGNPDTATSDFFICIGDQPSLDFAGKRNADGQGFAAFGKVLRGMDVVRKIQTSPVTAQVLTPPIRIIAAKRI